MAANAGDPRLATFYRDMAEAEERHAALWRGRLEAASMRTRSSPSWRARALAFLARRLGSWRSPPDPASSLSAAQWRAANASSTLHLRARSSSPPADPGFERPGTDWRSWAHPTEWGVPDGSRSSQRSGNHLDVPAVRALIGQRAHVIRVGEVMGSPPLVIDSNAAVRDTAVRMQTEQVHRLVAIDDHGRPLGVISAMDFVALAAEG